MIHDEREKNNKLSVYLYNDNNDESRTKDKIRGEEGVNNILFTQNCCYFIFFIQNIFFIHAHTTLEWKITQNELSPR